METTSMTVSQELDEICLPLRHENEDDNFKRTGTAFMNGLLSTDELSEGFMMR